MNIPLIDCVDIMPEEIIENSSVDVNDRSLRCLDPKIATVYSFKDGEFDHRKQNEVIIRFEYCLDVEPIEGVNCLSYDEAEKWFLDGEDYLHMFDIRTRVDYSSIENYWI